jgi:(4S)-4-hydroxy-5-phosphonooxypentane-2,3-dione isomerase
MVVIGREIITGYLIFTKKNIMIVTCVYVHVKPESVNDFIEASVLNHKGSVKEPGNLRFDFVQQSDDPCRFMLYEAFESEEAVTLHKTTDHYIKWRDTVKEMMAEQRYGVKYNIIEPKLRSEW